MASLDLSGTAIVVEVSEPVKKMVQTLRERFDPLLANNIPVEITIAGSSGMGPIASGQDGSFVLDELSGIVRRLSPFEGWLGKVVRFPGTNIFVFEALPRERFELFHGLLKDSKITFESTGFPFFPHCSLCIWSDPEPEQMEEMLEKTIAPHFWINSFALYQLAEGKAAVLVERFYLK